MLLSCVWFGSVLAGKISAVTDLGPERFWPDCTNAVYCILRSQKYY